jgi:prophage maintenance system killer protein
VTFLNTNGLDFEDSADLEQIVRDAVAGSISESDLAAILRSRCKKMGHVAMPVESR